MATLLLTTLSKLYAMPFWAHPGNTIFSAIVASDIRCDRMLRRLKTLDPGFPRDEPLPERPPNPTEFPTDVPAPEPHDVPPPEPIDVPPPDPGVPNPERPPERPRQEPRPRPIP